MESSHAYCPYEKPYAVNGGQTCCDRRLGGLPLESFEVHCDAAMSDEKEGSTKETSKQGLARGYGRITRKGGFPEWATSNLYNYNMVHSFYELFQDMKISNIIFL